MTIQRMEHVGIVVDDLAASNQILPRTWTRVAGREPGRGSLGGPHCWLEGVRAEIAMLQTPDGHGRLELTKYVAPLSPTGNQMRRATAGIRHIAFAVEDIDAIVASLRARGFELVGELEQYKDIYRLCYVRGPEGIIVELAERIG